MLKSGSKNDEKVGIDVTWYRDGGIRSGSGSQLTDMIYGGLDKA